MILPKKGDGAIVENFAFRISPRQEVPGRLLHRPGFGRRALLLWTRKGRVEGAMVHLLVEQRGGTLAAGGHQPGQAALLRLALGHGLYRIRRYDTPCDCCSVSAPLASVPEQCVCVCVCHPCQPHPRVNDGSILGLSEEITRVTRAIKK